MGEISILGVSRPSPWVEHSSPPCATVQHTPTHERMSSSNRYSKSRALGKGSFGEVWLVRDSKSGDEYVMKEVRLHGLSPAGVRNANSNRRRGRP